MRAILGTALVAGMAATASAGVISTAPSNNGTGGVFLSLTPTSSPLEVTSFDTQFGSATVGTLANVEVWVRSGAYAGFTASNAGWTLHGIAVGTAAGTTTNGTLVLPSPIAIPLGTTSIYLHSTTTGNGIRYTGTSAAPPQTTWINADVTLFSDVARTGAIPFGGSQFTPRTFSGNVNYNVVPSPASLALMGMAGLAFARRRR